MGHHSTSDDSSRYREQNEMDFWKESDNPIGRMRMYLCEKGWVRETPAPAHPSEAHFSHSLTFEMPRLAE
jgi:2-oxoisovalerate dehydrogenase E1 component alpha subunit